jgi:hypothetical protein
VSIDITEHHDSALLELRIGDTVTEDQMHRVGPAIERFADRHGRIDVLEHVGEVEGIQLGAATRGMRTDAKILSRIRKLAVLGTQSWVEHLARLGNRALGAEIRAFAPGQEAQARQWLAA